jgi:hypothetical protein
MFYFIMLATAEGVDCILNLRPDGFILKWPRAEQSRENMSVVNKLLNSSQFLDCSPYFMDILKKFLFDTTSRLVLGPTQPPIQ